jgi:hypothetical protein
MALSELALKHFISKYKPEYCSMIMEHCSAGRSVESFSAVVETVPEAMMFWANAHPEFEVCMHVAHWRSLYWWETQLIEDQAQIKECKTLQAPLYLAVMKFRYNWKDKADDLLVALSKLTDTELENRARRILQAKDIALQAKKPKYLNEAEEEFIKERETE